MTTYHPIDGGIASLPDDFDPDRPVGEVLADVTPALTVELWIVCWCTDDTHPEHEYAMRQVHTDSTDVMVPAWHANRAEAMTDYAYAYGDRHIVSRRMHIAVGEVA